MEKKSAWSAGRHIDGRLSVHQYSCSFITGAPLVQCHRDTGTAFKYAPNALHVVRPYPRSFRPLLHQPQGGSHHYLSVSVDLHRSIVIRRCRPTVSDHFLVQLPSRYCPCVWAWADLPCTRTVSPALLSVPPHLVFSRLVFCLRAQVQISPNEC